MEFDASSFVAAGIGAVSSLVAAIIGAASTHLFMIFKERRSYKLAQIRAINSAIVTSSAICDAVLQVKRQHLIGLKAFLKDEISRFENRFASKDDKEFYHFDASLIKISKVSAPVNYLSDMMYKDIDVNGKSIIYLYGISSSFDIFINAIENFNEIVSELSSIHSDGNPELLFRYLGVPNDQGMVDTRYSDFLEQMLVAIESCSAYSYLLCEELDALGDKIAKQFWWYKPSLTKVDFGDHKKAGVFPEDEYIDKLRQ